MRPNKKTLLFVILLVILIISFSLYQYFIKNLATISISDSNIKGQKTQTIVSPLKKDTSVSLMESPNTYDNFDFLFQIKYPDSWVVRATGFNHNENIKQEYLVFFTNKNQHKIAEEHSDVAGEVPEGGHKIIDGVMDGDVSLSITKSTSGSNLNKFECSPEERGHTCFHYYTTIGEGGRKIQAIVKTYETPEGTIDREILIIKGGNIFDFKTGLAEEVAAGTISVSMFAKNNSVADKIASSIKFYDEMK